MVEQQTRDFDDNPEWTSEDFAMARPAEEVHQPDVTVLLVRSPSDWEEVALELDAEVLAKFRATGPGWEARINDALRAADPMESRRDAA